ncbi:MAG: hypothetical protein H8E66_03570 [Planctomycetes bacterium]|nr:hypothetical protein [Planctomycetota bacterium]
MVTKRRHIFDEQLLILCLLAIFAEVPLHALAVSIQQSVRDFRSESSEWEAEMSALFDDVDGFLSNEGRAVGEVSNVNVAEDVAGLKGLVEQQTEVLTALVNALTVQPPASDSVDVSDAPTSNAATEEVDPFERLQQAVAAASESS